MSNRDAWSAATLDEPISLSGARCLPNGGHGDSASVEIANGTVTRIRKGSKASQSATHRSNEIDLTGYWLMPGLINAHDHLEYALYPRLADPPYRELCRMGRGHSSKISGPDCPTQGRAQGCEALVGRNSKPSFWRNDRCASQSALARAQAVRLSGSRRQRVRLGTLGRARRRPSLCSGRHAERPSIHCACRRRRG